MKKTITLQTKPLLLALKKVKPSIPSVAALTSLECVLFETSNNSVSIQGTNLEMYITCHFPSKCEAGIMFLANFKQLFALVKELPLSHIVLSYDDVNKKVSLECDNATYELGCDDEVGNFPKLPEIGDKITQRQMNKHIIDDCLKSIPFASTDPLRPDMTGICFDFRQKKLHIVATDAHAMYLSAPHISVFDERSFLVPTKGIKAICGIAKTEHGSLQLHDKHAVFFSDNTQIICRLIDAKFPDYLAIIPSANKFVSANRQLLIKTIKSLLPFANHQTLCINFYLKGSLKIEATDMDYNITSKKELPVISNELPEFDFAFNGKKINRVLETYESNTIKIYNEGGAGRAFIFREEDHAA